MQLPLWNLKNCIKVNRKISKMMKLITTIVVLLAVLMTEFSTSAYADNQGYFGVGGGYNFRRTSFMVAGRFVQPLSPNLRLAPALALDFDLDELVLDVDLHYTFSGTQFYALGGIDYANEDAGMNGGAGIDFNFSPKMKGYGEIKYVFFGWTGVVLNAGIYF